MVVYFSEKKMKNLITLNYLFVKIFIQNGKKDKNIFEDLVYNP
jgi:hypothetical protein